MAANGTNVTMSGCWGYQSGIDTPKGVFQPDLPPGIEPASPAVDFNQFENWICEQAVVGGTIVQGFEFAKLVTLIRNPDSSERNSTFRHFTLQIYSNSPDFIQLADKYGLLVEPAGNVSIQAMPVYESHQLVSYSYPPERKDYDVTQQLNDPPSGFTRVATTLYYLNQSRLARFFMINDGLTDTGNAGTIGFGPDSYWAKHSTATQQETLSNYRVNNTVVISFDPGFARG